MSQELGPKWTPDRTEEVERRANKRVTCRLIDGQWSVEFDVREGTIPLTPKELQLLYQAIRIRYQEEMRTYRLTQTAKQNNERAQQEAQVALLLGKE
jgi:hypothetical protein